VKKVSRLENSGVAATLKTLRSQMTISAAVVKMMAILMEVLTQEALSKSVRPVFSFWLPADTVVTD
jgi:hypothetical protein